MRERLDIHLKENWDPRKKGANSRRSEVIYFIIYNMESFPVLFPVKYGSHHAFPHLFLIYAILYAQTHGYYKFHTILWSVLRGRDVQSSLSFPIIRKISIVASLLMTDSNRIPNPDLSVINWSLLTALTFDDNKVPEVSNYR